MAGRRQRFVEVLVAAGVIVLVIAVAPAVWESVNRGWPQSRTLPDGTVVTLARVSYGRVFRYVQAKGWKKIAGQILPQKLAQRLGIPVQFFTNATPTIFVCLEAVKTNGVFSFQEFPQGDYGMYSGIRIQDAGASIDLEDDVGNGFLLSRTGFFVFAASTNRFSLATTNPYVSLFTIPLLSRKASRLKLHVNQYDTANRTNYESEFSVRNPAPRGATDWNPPPLPLTNRVDDLQVELLALEPGGAHEFQVSEMQGHTRFGTRARLRVLQNGVPTTAWRATAVTVADEAGNVFSPHDFDFSEPGVLAFDGKFPPREARKFRFELNRAPPFTTNEAIVARNVPLGVFQQQSNVTLQTAGYDLKIVWIGPVGAGTRKQWEFNAQITPWPSGVEAQVLFAARNQAGQEVLLKNFDARNFSYGLGRFSIPDSVISGTVDITFAVTNPRYVEFVARPPGRKNQ